MNKRSWFRQLERELTAQGVQKDERKEVLNYYNEMYRDTLEDGWTEREVLREFGFPEDVADSVHGDGRRERRRIEYRESYRDDYDSYSERPRRRKKRRGVVGTVLKVFFSVILCVVLIACMIAFFLTHIAVTIAGIAIIIAAFTLLGESMGAFIMVIGSGLAVMAIGGMIQCLGQLSGKCFKRIVKGRA